MEKEIKPVELCIEADEVVKRYPVSEAIEIVRCRTSFFLHSTCFWVVSKPTMANNFKGGALFEMLQWYCDYQDSRESYPKEEQEKYDTLCDVVVSSLILPLDLFTDINFCLDVAEDILNRRKQYYQRLQEEAEKEKPETLEDALENAAFEAEVEMNKAVLEDLSKMAKKDEVVN